MTTHADLRTPDEILALALEKEEQARAFYEELGYHCSVDFVKDLLLKLQNEESKHVRMIRDMLAGLASGQKLT
jgi:rubrerythrin